MAYLDTAFAVGAAGSAAFAPVSGLSDLERDAVGLARQDRPASLVRSGRARRMASLLFGLSAPKPLADERLEALRAFTVLVAHGADSKAARATLERQGFSWLQIEEAATLAAAFRRSPRTMMPGWAVVAGNAFAWTGAYLWVRLGVGNSFFAALAAAYYGLPAVITPRPTFH